MFCCNISIVSLWISQILVKLWDKTDSVAQKLEQQGDHLLRNSGLAKIGLKFWLLTSLNPISDENCTPLMHIFVEIRENTHKNKKTWLIF